MLSGLLVASPAQATDGSVSARVYYPNTSGSGGEARAYLDFTGRSDVTVRNLTVRDICPGDGRPVRAVLVVLDTDGKRTTIPPYYSDRNGCGSDGTNFGTYSLGLSDGWRIKSISLKVCVYNSSGNLKCATSAGRDNPYT
ncbi:hypothetical protein Kfla_6620 [Kribbella flavida DSM 17836]|uniref:Uncharacterized protein n=1 Tax=Kribbella flavida (strain DSM 17836 / JCM 10339 / NBRC 14399) TaxID=479435 RepID=D2PZP6_KRIFD|nr:hypothetical protein Kfla_6620 [Kribbella flavida DSM 17836]